MLLKYIASVFFMKRLLNIQDQQNMLDGILCWLKNNINGFIPQIDTNSRPEHISPDISVKAFSELGLALMFAHRSQTIVDRKEFKELRKLWISILYEKSFFSDIRRKLQFFPHMTLTYAALETMGKEDLKVKKDLQSVMQNQYMDRVERSAWDKLDMKYYTEAAGLKNQFPSYENLYNASMLHHLPSLSYATRHDLYGLTHLLFHFSDFSRRNMKDFAKDTYEEIQKYVDASLSLCVIEQDWDLVEELLINQYCMRKRFDSFDRHAAKSVKYIQSVSGFIPGRKWVQSCWEDETYDKNTFSFNDVYHPTIVGLILLTLETTNQTYV